jgi:hypothetical protein
MCATRQKAVAAVEPGIGQDSPMSEEGRLPVV